MKRFSFLVAWIGLGLCSYGLAQKADNQYPFAAGPITGLDSATKTITIQTPPVARTFSVTNNTYLIAVGAVIPFEKLKVGDPVKLNYFTNQTGQAIIRRLKVVEPTP